MDSKQQEMKKRVDRIYEWNEKDKVITESKIKLQSPQRRIDLNKILLKDIEESQRKIWENKNEAKK